MPDNQQQLHHELVCLITNNSNILTASIVDIYGDCIAFYSNRSPLDRDRIAAKASTFLSLAEHISGELSLGNWHYLLLAGIEGTAIYFPLLNDYGLVLIVQAEVALDTVFSAVKPTFDTLAALLVP